MSDSGLASISITRLFQGIHILNKISVSIDYGQVKLLQRHDKGSIIIEYMTSGRIKF